MNFKYDGNGSLKREIFLKDILIEIMNEKNLFTVPKQVNYYY